MEFDPQQFGKVLVGIGAVVIVMGLLLMPLGKIGLFRLPGNLEFGGSNWRLYFPLGTCVVLSILLTLVFWLIRYFRR